MDRNEIIILTHLGQNIPRFIDDHGATWSVLLDLVENENTQIIESLNG